MSIVTPAYICRILSIAISLASAWMVPCWAQDFSPIIGDAPLAPPTKVFAADYRAGRVYNAASSGLSIDPSQREVSRIAFDTLYQASEGVASGWTGNVARGAAGATSQSFRNNIALRINYFRAMAGVPAVVTLADAYNAKDQQAALMMSANNQLSHNPASSWLDYTADGAEAAANSNIALGYDGPAAITAYIQDNGSSNALLGHRRWLLYPQTATMGTGDVDSALNADGSTAYFAANALWVIDGNYNATRPAVRDDFVAWPPPGYVPYQLVFNRWSFAYPGADFSQASVSMQRGGGGVPVRLETQGNEYGENTLVWVPDDLDASIYVTAPLSPPNGDTTTTVTISNVLINGIARTFSYNVTVFDPHTPGADTVLPAIGGADTLTAGNAATYTFNAVPNASNYQWQAGLYSALAYSANAENGPGDVTFSPAATNLLTTTYHANGAAAYQLTSQPATALSLNPIIVPGPASALRFNSRFGYVTAKETAKAQISTDGGATWQDLYARTGGGGPDSAFAPITALLGDYAGKLCQIRFSFSNAGNYYLPSASVGWFIDDIAVTDAGQFTPLAAPTVLPAGARSFVFTPPQSGAYALQVTPVFYGQYADLNLAGPLKWLNAGVNPAQQPMAPILTSAPTAGAELNVAFSYQITATNNPTAFSAALLPPGLSLDGSSGQITGAPTAAGTYAVTLNIANAAGSTAAMLTLTVLPPTPIILGSPVVAGHIYTPFSYQISAAPAPTSFAADGLPQGLSVDNATGVISGVPVAEGDFPVTVSAANSSGEGTAVITLKITSAPMPTVTVATTVNNVRVGNGQAGEITFTRVGDDLSQDVVVYYQIAGGAVAGVDYQPIKIKKKIKAGSQTARVLVRPLGEAGNGDLRKVLKVSLQPGNDYLVGDAANAKVKMWW